MSRSEETLPPMDGTGREGSNRYVVAELASRGASVVRDPSPWR
jgi:hypothetical protein